MQRFLRVGHDPWHGPEGDPAEAQRSHKQPQRPETEKHQDIQGPANPSPSRLHNVTVHLNGIERTGTARGHGSEHVEDIPVSGEGEGVDEEESDQGDHHEVLGGTALANGVAQKLAKNGAAL